MKRKYKPHGLARFGDATRWSPPGRLARKKEPKVKSDAYPLCNYCHARHAFTTTCLQAASSRDCRGWMHLNGFR